jgi:hypothetical protein
LRWEKELAVRTAEEEKAVQARQKKVALELEEAELLARLKAMQMELQAKRFQKSSLDASARSHDAVLVRQEAQLRALRGVDKK